MKYFRKNFRLFLLASFLSLFVSCPMCSEKHPSGDEIVATIGGGKIYFSEIKRSADRLNRFLKENFETSDAWRKDFIRQYIAKQALVKRAQREGLAKDKDIIFTIEQARLGILADKLLERELNKISITDADLQKYYEENKGKYEKKSFEDVKRQVEFEYGKKLKDEAVNRFIMDTFVEEKVKVFDDVIARVKP